MSRRIVLSDDQYQAEEVRLSKKLLYRGPRELIGSPDTVEEWQSYE